MLLLMTCGSTVHLGAVSHARGSWRCLPGCTWTQEPYPVQRLELVTTHTPALQRRRTMNAVNRIVMILLSLVTFAFGVISLLLLAGILQPIWVSPAGALMSQWQWIARLQGADKITGWIVFGDLTLACG